MASEEKKYLGQPGAERLIANLREEIKACKTEQEEALAEHKEDSSVHVTAEEKEVLLGAVDHVHEHSNKEVLDNIASTVDIYTQADEPVEPAEDSIWVKDGVNGLPPSILIRKNGVWVMVSDGEAQKQADWNETDGTSASYIRNKPFGEFDDLYSNSSLPFSIDDYAKGNIYTGKISDVFSGLFDGIMTGDDVTVIWDNAVWNLTAKEARLSEWVSSINIIGNARIINEYYGCALAENTSEPFCVFPAFGTIYTRSTLASHSVIIKYKDKVVKIDPKYLPDEVMQKSLVQMVANGVTENLPTFQIHKLTQAEYDALLESGSIDENALYLTPDEENEEIDLSGYATEEYVDNAISAIPAPDVSGQINDHNLDQEAHVDIRALIPQVQIVTWEDDD